MRVARLETGLQDAITFIQAKTYDVTLALATFDEVAEHPSYRSLNITERVANDFRAMASERVEKLRKLWVTRDAQLIPYTAGFKSDEHQIEYIELADDDLSSLLQAVPSPAQIPLIGDVAGFVDHVRFYTLLMSGPNRRAVLFRRYNRNKELRQSKNIVMRLIGEQYDVITEPTFQFDTSIDAILFGTRVYILNKSNFQHIFRYYEQLQALATESLETIKARVPIKNFDGFRESCLGHLQKLEKLRNISVKPYLAVVTLDDLERTIRNFKLNVVIEDNQLVFDDSDRWGILNLLDDAYLGSEMTGLRYEVNSKRQVT